MSKNNTRKFHTISQLSFIIDNKNINKHQENNGPRCTGHIQRMLQDQQNPHHLARALPINKYDKYF